MEDENGERPAKELEAALLLHFQRLPVEYGQYAFTAQDVTLHMALLREAERMSYGTPAVRVDVKDAADCSMGGFLYSGLMGHSQSLSLESTDSSSLDDSGPDDYSMSSSGCLSPRSTDEPLDSNVSEGGNCRRRKSGNEMLVITFAYNIRVCRHRVAVGFRRSGLRLRGVAVWDASRSCTLGVVVGDGGPSTWLSQQQVEDVLLAMRANVSDTSFENREKFSGGKDLRLSSLVLERKGERGQYLPSSPLRSSSSLSTPTHPSRDGKAGGFFKQWKLSSLFHHQQHHDRGQVQNVIKGSGRVQDESEGTGVEGSSSYSTKNGFPSPSGLMHVLLSESESVRHKLSRWMLDADQLQIGSLLGTGSSGEVRKGVYQGVHDVAVKILKRRRPEQDAMAEFRREVITLMSCGECQQLLPFFGICVDACQGMCIVTKYMPGGTLHDQLHKEGGEPLPIPRLVRAAKDIAFGMEYLHQHGMIHRDLKTANIFVDENGGTVVGDFGVVRLRGERGEMTKEVGTYRWMAPEALGTSPFPVTTAADVYSFSIVLWELLTAKIPYSDYSPVQAAVGVALNDLRPEIPANCPDWLRQLMQKCWARDPEARPTFAQVLSQLAAVEESVGLVAGQEEHEEKEQ
eukprot:TRINITY_DN3641_c0_g3_i1.p1 TRINITY_DN3641_c0_g3~~TRINITY_DN3641_c0_g3_i1.p1  ORF type:complete len:655 (-),score=150.28 TRINITY_DN3641_c0_g3_i1:80-1966(-)